MLLKDFMNKIKTIRKGTFTNMTYCTTKNGYSKTVSTKVRFVDYYNIKSVKESGKTPNPNGVKVNPNIQTIIPHILTYNTNTQNYLVHCYTTPKTKAVVVYKDSNGNEITKAEYEMVNPPKPFKGDKVVYQIKLQDLIQLG